MNTKFPVTEKWLRSLFDQEDYLVFMNTLQCIHKGSRFLPLRIYFSLGESGDELSAGAVTSLLSSIVGSLDYSRNNVVKEVSDSMLNLYHTDERFPIIYDSMLMPTLTIKNPLPCDILGELSAIKELLNGSATEMIERL